MMTKNDSGLAPAVDDLDEDDAPILTEAETGDVEVFEGDTFIRRGRGRPVTGKAKELVSIRLDPEVLAELRKAGPGWQSKVNDILREAVLAAPDVSTRADSSPTMCEFLASPIPPAAVAGAGFSEDEMALAEELAKRAALGPKRVTYRYLRNRTKTAG